MARRNEEKRSCRGGQSKYNTKRDSSRILLGCWRQWYGCRFILQRFRRIFLRRFWRDSFDKVAISFEVLVGAEVDIDVIIVIVVVVIIYGIVVVDIDVLIVVVVVVVIYGIVVADIDCKDCTVPSGQTKEMGRSLRSLYVAPKQVHVPFVTVKHKAFPLEAVIPCVLPLGHRAVQAPSRS